MNDQACCVAITITEPSYRLHGCVYPYRDHRDCQEEKSSGMCLQVRERLQAMQNTIMAAGKIATNDLDAETMLITCTNQLQQRFQRLSIAVYEAGDRAEGRNHLHLAPRLDELAKSYISKASTTSSWYAH